MGGTPRMSQLGAEVNSQPNKPAAYVQMYIRGFLQTPAHFPCGKNSSSTVQTNTLHVNVC